MTNEHRVLGYIQRGYSNKYINLLTDMDPDGIESIRYKFNKELLNMGKSEEAKEAQARYMQQYRAENRERIRKYNAEWRKNNPDRVRAAQNRYWEKEAENYKEDVSS